MSQIIASSELSDEQRKYIRDNHPSFNNILHWTDEQYFSDISLVSNSHLKILSEKGPLHLLKYIRDKQNGIVYDDKPHELWGSAFHCAVLEPNDFYKKFYTLDETQILRKIGGAKPRGTNQYKDWVAEEQLKHVGKKALDADDYSAIMRIRDKVNSISQCRDILEAAHIKEKVFQGSLEGVPVKCKPDAMSPGNFGIELKSTKDSPTFQSFLDEVKWNHYDRQTSFYKDIIGVESYWIIACEKTSPHQISMFEVSELTYGIGVKKYTEALNQWKQYFGKGASFDEQKFIYFGQC